MLAELHELSVSLDRFGLSVTEVHPWVKPLGKGRFLIANLGRGGSISSVEIPDEMEAVRIPKIQKDNQNAFPAFKLAFPLFEVSATAAVRQALKDKSLNDAIRADLIRAAVADSPIASLAKNGKRLGQLIKFSGEIYDLIETALPDCLAVGSLLGILRTGDISAESFLRELGNALISALAVGESTKTAQLVLIGELNKEGKIDEGELPLVFDVARDGDHDFVRVAHAKTGLFYSRALLTKEHGEADGICCITGDRSVIERSILPSPRLPSLADTILFSANSDIPCLRRYGLIGSETFPIGQKTSQKLNNTALWITAPDRKGKTWSMIPQSTGGKRDLVIAYVDIYPDLNADLAELLSDTDAVQREGAFEAKTETLVKALDQLRGRIATGGVLHSFVLRRISKGQVQVDMTRQFPVDVIRTALIDWKNATANTPTFSLMVPIAKGQPATVISPKLLFPGEIVEATKWVWIRGGSERQSASGISVSDVFDLFLGESFSSVHAADLVISNLLQKCLPLLLLVGDQLTRHGRTVNDMSKPARYAAVTAVTLLGVALYKLSRKKEFYMNETAYLLGRMLALSDTLHSQYCQVVRGGDLPPQLLGNQHYQMAVEHPQRAFAVLSERLRVYKGWAQTARADGEASGRAVGLARWALSEMGSVAVALHGNLPDRLKDVDRAEMMLGYLAREKKSEDKNE